MVVNSVGMVKGAMTQGARLIKAIKTPDVVLDVEHLVGAKYIDVLKSLGVEGFFARKYCPTKVVELPSGNKLVKLSQKRFRGAEPVDPYHDITLKFNREGDCLQLVDIDGYAGGPRRTSIIRTPKGKDALRPYVSTEPTTYKRVDDSKVWRTVMSGNIGANYGYAKTVQFPGAPADTKIIRISDLIA